MGTWLKQLPPMAIVRCAAMLAAWLLTSLSMVAEQYREVLTMGGSCVADAAAASAELGGGLILLAVEFAIIVAIVRPWSYRRSWLRSLGACVVFYFVSGHFVFTCSPNDAFTRYHTHWLIGGVAIFFFFTLWSAAAAFAAYTRKR
jgi:hypothetical protein